LLNSGADVNKAARNGVTALQRAASEGHEEIVKLLLNSGADVNKAAADGVTALQKQLLKGTKK